MATYHFYATDSRNWTTDGIITTTKEVKTYSDYNELKKELFKDSPTGTLADNISITSLTLLSK